MTAQDPTRCPVDQVTKRANEYLCRGCWVTLPLVARRALNKRDDDAGVRLLELHRQLNDGIRLIDIAIRP
jgi:hypothetical protein